MSIFVSLKLALAIIAVGSIVLAVFTRDLTGRMLYITLGCFCVGLLVIWAYIAILPTLLGPPPRG